MTDIADLSATPARLEPSLASTLEPPSKHAPEDAATPAQAAAAQSDALRSVRFRLERETHWRRLDQLVTRAEKAGIVSLSYDDTTALATSYRQAMNSLSVARDISLDRALIDYLENLCSRAYLVVYAPQQSIAGLAGNLLVRGIPQAVRRSTLPLIIGFLALILGAVAGYRLFDADATWFYSLVPSDLAGARTPDAPAAYLRSTLYGSASISRDELAAFSAALFSNNTKIAMLIFALGIFLSVPSFALTFFNGLMLGAFFGLFASKGLGYDAFAWLSIHGVTEMAAIAIACSGGARLGLAVLLPGPQSRRDALRRQMHDAVKLVILAGLMLIAAACVEGFLRQLIQAPVARLAIGWGLGAFWLAWLSLSGREPVKAEAAR